MMYSHNKKLNRHFQSCLLIVCTNFSLRLDTDADAHRNVVRGRPVRDPPDDLWAFSAVVEASFSLFTGER